MIRPYKHIRFDATLNADAALIPVNNYDCTTKKYVDDEISASSASQDRI